MILRQEVLCVPTQDPNSNSADACKDLGGRVMVMMYPSRGESNVERNQRKREEAF